MNDLAQTIRDKALALGYDNCGIVKINAVADYHRQLEERMKSIPKGKMQFGRFRGLGRPQKRFPWAKSIIVFTIPYTNYSVPNVLQDRYAKAYLFDIRLDEHTAEFQRRRLFSEYLDEIGVKHVGEEKFGITALRLAAQKAGLGFVRRNNFFYSAQHGSYLFLDAFLIDRELECIETAAPEKPCPPNCDRCIEACPSKSLTAPFTMSLTRCVSFQTSFSADVPCMGVPSDAMVEQIGCRLYGCDVCQDVCPFNKDKMVGGQDFPGLVELLPHMSPQRIMEMSYDEIGKTLGNKFWYVGPKKLWKWKLDALTVMMNDFRHEYAESIRLGLKDRFAKVRTFAKKVCRKLEGKM